MWTATEDALLREGVRQIQIGPKKLAESSRWKKIAEFVPNRDHVQCVQRWTKALDPTLTKGPWTSLEDQLLLAVKAQSEGDSWSSIAAQVPGMILSCECLENT